MAFYQNAKPRKMTRQDHLRAAAGKWEDEGARYRKSTRSAESESFDDRSGGKNGYDRNHTSHSNGSFRKDDKAHTAYRPASGKGGQGGFRPQNDSRFDTKPARSFGDRPETRPAPVKPAPEKKPAPVVHSTEEEHFVPENLLSGRNPIREALKAGRDIEKLLVAKGELSGSAREIVAMAREKHIPVQVVERTRLDEITHSHQGMLAFASAYRYADVEDMLEEAKEKGEAPFLIVLDGITDPMNLGAIIRTAACVGAHGVIVPERRAAGLTPAAVKASAGAVEVVKVARVTNLNRTLEMLKAAGVWLYAADMNGEDFRRVNFSGPAALIIGAEGEGVSRLVLNRCDRIVSIPMSGKLDSLNASVAAGVLMYAMANGR